jgi:molybdopterin molybdotransferase
VAGAPVTLEVIEEIPAGRWPGRALGPGQASRIMTGAPLPEGADAVQMVEKTRAGAVGRVEILEPVAAGDHIRRAGEDLRQGSPLIEVGTILGAVEIGLLATAGRSHVSVSRPPHVAIVPTGDELVPVDREPGPSQIRESNGHTLEALVRLAGGRPDLREIAADTVDALRASIDGALSGADVLLMSGGVSMGDYDLVGGVLKQLGCEPRFDRVAIQPGKPLFFGTIAARRGGPAGPSSQVLVFGLPGNPVSTVVDFLVFARPALRRILGASAWRPREAAAALAEPVERRPGRRGYIPATLEERNGRPVIRLIRSMGSADMVAVSRADALAIIPEDAARLEAGATVRALRLDELTRP